MKIEKDSVYEIKLSGHQILLIQTMIVNSDVRESLNTNGLLMADILYDSLEHDVEKIK